MSVLYGVEDNYKDVTMIVLQRCIVKGFGNSQDIAIPQGDDARAAIFGDPVYGKLKHIVVKYDGKQLVYPHYHPVQIPLAWIIENIQDPKKTESLSSTTTKKWIIITSSLINRNFDIRKDQYTRGIDSLVKRCADKYNIILVENNGHRQTFFDEMECVKNGKVRLFYTTNNFLPVWNIGTREQLDVLTCILHFAIPDDDFIVKMSGRYYLDENCPFFDALDSGDYDAVIRFGNYKTEPMEKCGDCILGLAGMRCKYLKTVKVPEVESLELNWAAVAKDLPNVYVIRGKLGIWIAPASNEFYMV